MTWVIVAVAVLLLIVAVLVGLVVARRQRSRRLRSDFGPEYDRVLADRGDQRSAEQELAGRQRRLDKFEIRPLDPATRDRYLQWWRAVQRSFVDEPGSAVIEAHLLVQQVMRDRGYPVEDDFEQRAADISVEHAGVVENYRAAHAISVRAQNGQADTEQLRQSMVHFRALFTDLLDVTEDRRAGGADESFRGAVPQQTTREG